MTKFDLTTYDGRMAFIDYCKDNTELDAEFELINCIEDLLNPFKDEVSELEQKLDLLNNEHTAIIR